jgi:ArsR family transcriptional regulator
MVNISPLTLYPAIAHQIRLRCILLLLEYGELCVCELTHAIAVAQPTVSRHLAYLRESRLVRDRREGLWIHYRINPELPSWVINVLHETARGVHGVVPFSDDVRALKDRPDRSGASRCA